MAMRTYRKKRAYQFSSKRVSGPAAGVTGNTGYYGETSYGEYLSRLKGHKGRVIYDEMRRSDPQVKAVLAAITLPIRQADYYIQPGAESAKDKRIAEVISENLFEAMTVTWDDVVRHALLMLPFGFSILEKVWELKDGLFKLRKLDPRLPQSVIRWEYDRDQKRLVGPVQVDTDGKEYLLPIEKVLIFISEREGDNWEGISVLRSAYKPWFLKNDFEKINAIKHDRHGVGIPKAKVPATVREGSKEWEDTRQALESLYANERSYIIEPEGYEFDLVGGTNRAGTDTLSSIKYYDEMIARAMLAMFLNLGTTETGSRALGMSFIELFLRTLQAYANYICEIINRFCIREYVDYNWYVKSYPVLKVQQIKELDPQVIAGLVQAGVITNDLELENTLRSYFQLPERQEKEGEKQERKQGQESGKQEQKSQKQEGEPEADGKNRGETGETEGDEEQELGEKSETGVNDALWQHYGSKDGLLKGQEGAAADAYEASRRLDGSGGKIETTSRQQYISGEKPPGPARRHSGIGENPDTKPTDRMSIGETPYAATEAPSQTAAMALMKKELAKEETIPDLMSIELKLDSAERDLEKAVLRIRDDQVLAIIEQVVDGKRLQEVTVPGKKEMFSLCMAAYRQQLKEGRRQIRAELAFQKAKLKQSLAEPNTYKEYLEIMAEELAIRIEGASNKLLSILAASLVELKKRGITGDALRQGLRGKLAAKLSAKGWQDIASGVISKGWGAGRDIEIKAQADAIEYCYYSTVLDRKVCSICVQSEGKEHKAGDPGFVTPNPDCLGGDRCRCMTIAVYSREFFDEDTYQKIREGKV